MKKLFYFLASFILVATNADAQQVGTDKKLGSGLKNYSTYEFSEELDKIPQDAVFIGPNNVVVFNNESTRSNIKEAVRYELNARGYKMVEKKPDFIVNFIVLEKAAELTTYNGYRLIHNGMDTVRTKENLEEIEVKPGTLLLSFIDFQTGKEVWRGYASGILKPDMVNDRSQIGNAVKSIFDEYNYGPLAKK